MSETVLIVDDEESVRRTLRELLAGLPDCRVLAAADAEEALLHASREPVDLAILDWNLGAGINGLQLLEDLRGFAPDVVAVLITAYAQQATPLDALRMGVRDYLEKPRDLARDVFLPVIRRQLDSVRPAKRQRQVTQTLAAFREAVEKVLPLVNSAAALNDPVPLPEAVAALLRFLARAVDAADGVLLVRRVADDGTDDVRAFDIDGRRVEGGLVPFSRSVAATAVSLQEPCVMSPGDNDGSVEMQPFERGRSALLAAPVSVGPGVQAVFELFDKPGGFGDADRRRAAAAADLGAELLRHALAVRQTHRVLFDAVAAALTASEQVGAAITGPSGPPSDAVLQTLRAGLEASPGAFVEPASTLRLAEAVRVLAVRHGEPAVEHCVQLVESLRRLLDGITGAGES